MECGVLIVRPDVASNFSLPFGFGFRSRMNHLELDFQVG